MKKTIPLSPGMVFLLFLYLFNYTARHPRKNMVPVVPVVVPVPV